MRLEAHAAFLFWEKCNFATPKIEKKCNFGGAKTEKKCNFQPLIFEEKCNFENNRQHQSKANEKNTDLNHKLPPSRITR